MNSTKLFSDSDRSLTTTELALRWRITAGFLKNRRLQGQPPPYFKVGKAVRYRMSDVTAFETAMLKSSTADRDGQ
jgi:hypothetical protein